MSDIVRVSVNSTVKTVSIAVNQTTKVVMVDVKTAVAELVVKRRAVADGAPVDDVTVADYLGQQCIVGDANGPFTVYTASQVSPSRWTTSTDIAATWGNITGALSNQADLSQALSGKLGTSATATAANALATPRAINGTNFDGTAPITITAAANTLTGTTLNSTVIYSSLTTLGTVTSGIWNAGVISGAYGGTGVNNGIHTITLNNSNFAVSGTAFAIILASSGAGTVTYTMPTTSATIARTDAAQTFAGVQSFSSVPVFSALTRTSAYLNAAQTLTVSVYDIVKFDTVEFGSGFNTGTNTYTVPYTGYLRVTGAIGVNSGPTGGFFVVTVFKGGAMLKRCFSNIGNMSGGIAPFSVIIPVTASDSITIRVYSSPAATLFANTTDTWCQFEMLPN